MTPTMWLLAAYGAYSLLHRLLGGATFMHSFLPATHGANATQFFTQRGRCAAPSEALTQHQRALTSSFANTV